MVSLKESTKQAVTEVLCVAYAAQKFTLTPEIQSSLDKWAEGYIHQLEASLLTIMDDDSYNAGYRACREEVLRFMRDQTK